MSADSDLAPMLFRQLVIATDDEAATMLVLESMIVGVLLLYRGGDLIAQAALLDQMTERVVERLGR